MARRFLLVTVAGAMGTVMTLIGDSVWFHLPLDYALGATLYEAVSWLLLGGVLGAYLTPARL